MADSRDSITDPEGTFVLGKSSNLFAAAAAAQRCHYLVVLDGAAKGQRFEIPPEGITFGRSDAADVTLRDGGISKVHCRVEALQAALRVIDLNSTNGTYIDGSRVTEPKLVGPESVLEIGGHLLKFEYRDRNEVAQSDSINEELRVAQDYVKAVLPAPRREADLRIDWTFVPSSMLGGDAFGYHDLDEEHLAVYLLDVSGHGVGAAMHGVSAVNTLRHESLTGVDFHDPAAVLNALNETYPMDDHGGFYFTAWYGVLNRKTRLVKYATAGHPPGLLVRGTEVHELKTKGPGIGLFPGLAYQAGEIQVEDGDVLHVFSDGVFEVRRPDGEDWSLAGLRARLAIMEPDTRNVSERVKELVEDLTGQKKWEDDFSLVCISFGNVQTP